MLTAGSSVISFQPPNVKPTTFAQAREAWLQRWQGESQLTHADQALVTQVFLHFNTSHFERTGQLLAWPTWETVGIRARLSEASVFRAFRKLKRLGALEIIHGGRDPRTGWKLPNKYLAILSPPFTVKGGHLSGRQQATFQDESRLFESVDSSNQGTHRRRKKERKNQIGLSRKESQKPKEDLPPSDSPIPSPSKGIEGVPRAAQPEVAAPAPTTFTTMADARKKRAAAKAKRYAEIKANGGG